MVFKAQSENTCLHKDHAFTGERRAARLSFLDRLEKEMLESTTQDDHMLSYVGMIITEVSGADEYLVSQEGCRMELMSRVAYYLKNCMGC